MALYPMTNEEEPKVELTPEQREQVENAAGLGMPWRLIAALITMTLDDLNALRRKEPDLAKAVRKAEAACMESLLKRLQEAKQWQALTFVLQSRWPANFGRNRKPRKKKPVEPPPSRKMLERLTPEQLTLYNSLLDIMYEPEESPAPAAGIKAIRSGEDPAHLCLPGVANP